MCNGFRKIQNEPAQTYFFSKFSNLDHFELWMSTHYRQTFYCPMPKVMQFLMEIQHTLALVLTAMQTNLLKLPSFTKITAGFLVQGFARPRKFNGSLLFTNFTVVDLI
jgi:hypothetical protein